MNAPTTGSRFRSGLLIVAVNVTVLLTILLLVELVFRFSEQGTSPVRPPLQWLQFEPFTMFRNPHNPGASYQWSDAIHGRIISARIQTNSLGFAERQEFDFARMRPKGTDERVVVLTGGSAAWGVGATTNETTIAGRLQIRLNEKQRRYRYTVINMGMGGWVSVQQFISLAMYGRNLQPDWLVSMDGTNDAAVACGHSQGAGRVMHYAMMDAYMKAYVFGQLNPVFYRGMFENYITKHSATYRRLTGSAPIRFDVLVDARDAGVGRSIINETSWADVERQLELYIQMEGSIVDLFPRSKIILSTQPLPFNFEDMFGRVYQYRGTPDETLELSRLEKRNADSADASRGRKCGLELWDTARIWFMSTSALRLEAIAKARSGDGEIHYVNTGALFPTLMLHRNAFFIDPVHLNDEGMDVVASQYADMILASDMPGEFPESRWAGRSLPEPPTGKPAANEIRILEATYGLNCKEAKVPAPAINTVRLGNASEAVATACAAGRGKCIFVVDAQRMGDPANSCAKDFSASWQCGSNSKVYDAYLAPEANGKSLTLACAQE